jgi:hypothetical protein
MKESQLQAKLLKALKPYGWFYKASDRFRAGVPDIIGCYRGKFVALELKIIPNVPTKLQEYEIKRIMEEGGSAQIISYDNSTKLYKADTTEYSEIGDLVQCILKRILSSISSTVSSQSETGTTTQFSWNPD